MWRYKIYRKMEGPTMGRKKSAAFQIFWLRHKLKVIFLVALFVALHLVRSVRRFYSRSFGDISSFHKKDIRTGVFELSTGNEQLQSAYYLALSEVKDNIHDKNYFIAGAGWTQLWTRDTSFAVELAAGILHPSTAQSSLITCTEQVDGIGVVWLQDKCSHFGGWPNLSDAISGARGAWSLYLINGDKAFALWAYIVTKNSLLRAERDAYDSSTGLFRGCSSFMESNSGYPAAYKSNGKKVGKTKALSTNMLYYDGYHLAALMGNEVNASQDEISLLKMKATKLQQAIRKRLWRSDLGYYSYMESYRNVTADQMEGLGEALVLLSDGFETDPERIESIFQNTHRTSRGLPCLWPRFNIPEKFDIASYYHNGRIWPFVQGYWAIAAARHSKLEVFEQELNSLISLSQEKNTFAEFYELDGSFPSKRSRQLWSGSGFLGMVYYGLFGIFFTPEGIKFQPSKPEGTKLGSRISLENMTYRSMVLDIYISGKGTKIKTFKLDGVLRETPFLSATSTGHHVVEIELEL